MGWYISTALLAAPFIVATLHMALRVLKYRIEGRGYALPPGPTPLPLLGSVLSVHSKLPWLTYTEWRAKYGDIIYIRLLDTDTIVLNTISIATELLDKRSRLYSDRPHIAILKPYGQDCNFGFARYGEQWRLCRRIFHQTFHPNIINSFRPMQLRRAQELISNIIDDPEKYQIHFNTFAVSVSMSAVYDYDPIPRNDPMVSIINKYSEASFAGLAPGKVLLVKIFPFLFHIPDWFPGSWIRREAREAYVLRNKAIEIPYQYVQKRMESKDHMNAAMVPDHITRMEKLSSSDSSEYEIALKYTSVSASLGSIETTTSALRVFLLAMVKNPRIWKHAQVVIDTVVGTERLPEFDDREFLPYIDAIVRETLRWRPVVPVVQRALTGSDIYNGYYLPKGATVLVNLWAISRDEARYPDAEKFIPERFLDGEGGLTDDDPSEFIFGFGRRRCPGRHAADGSLWSAIVTMLATLDFNLAKDADGNDIKFEATFANGITEHPNVFPCQLTPRAHVGREALPDILAK